MEVYSEEHYQARDRVKVGEFWKKGYVEKAPLRSIMHVGANDGYEVEWYLKLGVERVLCFEPLEAAAALFEEKYGGDKRVMLIRAALGNINSSSVKLNIASGNGGGSSVFDLANSEGDGTSFFMGSKDFVGETTMVMWRYRDYLGEATDKFDCVVIDVQGMELDVLRGMDEWITMPNYYVIECSEKPVYKGGATAAEVVAYMARYGFVPINSTSIHDDILFVKKDLVDADIALPTTTSIPSGNKLNCGSGQRPFSRKHGWINIDINPRWNPDLLTDWNNLAMFEDDSMDMVVSHHSLEHVGCGEADMFIKEAHRVLKPKGSLLIFVPDMKALCQRFLTHEIDEYTFMVNVYGAYMGDETDRHRWGYSRQGLWDYLKKIAPWHDVHAFNWREIAGADIARDWWIQGMEAVK